MEMFPVIKYHVLESFHEIHSFTLERLQRDPWWINLVNLDIHSFFCLSVPNLSKKEEKKPSPLIFKYNASGIQLDKRQ